MADKLIRTFLALLLVAMAACSQPNMPGAGGEAPKPKEPAGMTAISPTEPPAGRPVALEAAVPNLELVPSQGDCAPRYANGQMGACINSKPCRGLGMRASTGAAECRCWARLGGCAENERCDGLAKACVPESKADFGRGDAD